MKGKVYLAMLAGWLLVLSGQEGHAQFSTVTPHDLLPEQKIEVDGVELPQWKIFWDEARKSAMQGDFEKSLQQYKALLDLKSNLGEARWEMTSLLIYLKDWPAAAELLEILIESEPDNTQYLNGLGKVMWEMGQYERAVDLFKRVNEKKPRDKTALAGLIEGLNKLGRRNEALPYLEQLTRQEPTNRGVRRYLAFLLYEAGNYEKARPHFTILSRNEDVELEVLIRTAKTYERLNLEQQASAYWVRVLAREPDNIEAHVFLAQYYEKKGQLARSLPHLEAIVAQRPKDIALYIHLGEMFEKEGNDSKALSYYEKYLAQKSDNHEIQHRVAAINAAMLKKKQMQASLQRHATSGDQEQAKTLKQNISNFEATGHYRDAIPLYRQLLEIFPDDPVILAALADDLIAVRKNEGNISMVKFLSEIVPDDLSIYRSVADLLRRLNREDELLAILHKINELDPGDVLATQELANIYFNRGELLQSRKYFAVLLDSGCNTGRCLETRAVLAEKLGLPAHGLQDYEALLYQEPNRFDIRLKAIDLAAHMGRLDIVLYHAGYLQGFPPTSDNLDLKILLADSYRESGYMSKAIARYHDIIEQTRGKKEGAARDIRLRSWLSMAESYGELGLPYEAEQTLRTALVQEKRSVPILEALFSHCLENGRIPECEIWLQTINREMEELQPDITQPPNLTWKKDFLQAEMYDKTGDRDLAVDLYEYAETLLPATNSKNIKVQHVGKESPLFRVRIHLAASLLHWGKYAEAEKIILGMQDSHEGELELLVLLEQVYLAWGKEGMADKIAGEARAYAAQDFGRQLNLARLYRKYKNISRQTAAAATAVENEPDSLAAKQLLLDGRIKQGEYFVALELVNQFLGGYPENTLFLSRQANLFAALGNFQEALAVGEMILAENPARYDIVLLQARILWEMKRWKDAVSLYESILEPPVEKILAKKIQEQGLSIDQPARKISWKEFVSSGMTSLIMAPEHAVDFSESGQMINAIAAPQYALYRWQDRDGKELSVRRSVMRREYYHAANKLDKVIEEYGSNDFLLYDLAGLYSRLERLGDEASLYRKLEAENASFPGLAEAVQRNNLKRRPQVFLAYNLKDDDGWDGYKSVHQKIVKGGGKYYRSNRQVWQFDLARINYESKQDDQKILSWRPMVNFNARLSPSLGLSLGGGLEKLESGYGDIPLLYGAVTGKIADEMRAVFSAKQDAVVDTVASLKRNIKRRDYKIEFMFDLFPRLLFGGYFDFMDYSDSNWTNNYTFWASYIVLPEPTLFKISYNYDFYDSQEGQNPGVPSGDGFALDDHPYWSPTNYWVTRFSFYFKNQLSNDALVRGIPSYYTLEYSVGYDSTDNDLHELKGSLHFEIAKNYVLSASYGLVDFDAYQHKEMLLSVMYRF